MSRDIIRAALTIGWGNDMIDKKEMKRLCEAATPEPWNIGGIQPHGTHVYGAGEIGIPVSWCSTASTVGKDGRYYITWEEAESNARFIAAARSAVPKLLAENAALQARVQELEKTIVPAEPTHAMCLAGNSLLPSTHNADEVWQAMIAASTTAAQSHRHDWTLIGSAGVWVSCYKCTKCGEKFWENTDSSEERPEFGCTTAAQKEGE